MSRRRLPNRRVSQTYSFRWQGMDFIATVSRFPDGKLAEIFLSNGKIDSTADVIARDSAVLCSIALQFGADVEVLRKALLREPETGRANAARRDGQSFLAATMEGEMMTIIQSEAGETPDATTVRRDFDDWSRYDLEFRIAFIDSAIEDLEVFDLKDGISALEDERERIEARLRDFDDDDAEEAEEDSV